MAARVMAVREINSKAVVAGVKTLSLGTFFSISPSAGNPPYLVLNVLDRNEYTAGATGATGYLSGNGARLALAGIGGDGRGAGIVFTWQAAGGHYVNATYGALDHLTYTSSASAHDVTDLSLFGCGDLALAQQYAANAYALMHVDAAGYIGSVSVVTAPHFSGVVPAQATPHSVAAVAQQFVGQAWNDEGCWVLASTIAAEAGAALPVQSTAIGGSGAANGEWMVLYNGPAGASGDWQSLVGAGDIVVFGTPGDGGHVTTCVSGSGATAMLVDNIVYENAQGQITNAAHDGSAADVLIAAPHRASQEWSGVSAQSVVIYALDTPVVTPRVATLALAAGARAALATLFAARDPAGRGVTAFQVYDTNRADSLMLGKALESAHTAGSALTVTSLASLVLIVVGTAGSDTIEMRANNGAYWGDWASLVVTVGAPVALGAGGFGVESTPRFAAELDRGAWASAAHLGDNLVWDVAVVPFHSAHMPAA